MSVMIANNATTTAPWITYAVLKPLRPIMIGVPSVLVPTVEAIAAVPILIITEVRIPATITGAANGNSTRHKTCQRLIPTP
ncbi:hypothetical protein D3C80_1704740 [compost metagenome]